MWAIPRREIILCKGTFQSVCHSIFNQEIIEGDNVTVFERSFAAYIGNKDAISVSSGTAALSLILQSLPLNKGDEIISTAYTFPSIPSCIKKHGFILKFIDISSDNDNLSIAELKRSITSNTKVIIATHLFGKPCNIVEIMEIARGNNIYVIEDCAHAIGSEVNGQKVGSFGDAAYFSFSITKPFNTFNGGMITSNNDEIIASIRQKGSKLPNLPMVTLLKNIIFAYFLYFLTRPIIFTLFLFPLLVLLSFLRLDLIKLYNKTFKNFVSAGCISYKLTNLQALIGIKMLSFYNRNLLLRQEKLKEFYQIYKENNITDNIDINLGSDLKYFPYYFIFKTHKKKVISHKLLMIGVDTGKELMSNCGKIFSETLPFTNTERAYSNSIQIPIEKCSYNRLEAISQILKEEDDI